MPTDLRPSHAGIGRTIIVTNNSPDDLLVSEQYTDHLTCCSIGPSETCTVTQLWYDLAPIKIILTDERVHARKIISVDEENERIDFSPIVQSYSVGLTNLTETY